MIYQDNIILFSHKKKWNTDNQNFKVNKPQNYHAKWKKPDTKCHILYDFIHIK